MMEIPKHLRGRPTFGGYIVPYFVAWFLGDEQVDERTPGAKPDFKVTDQRRLHICRQKNVCWICGKQMGTWCWFAFGPSSALGRVSMEPPSHRDCAHYAVHTCPYMINPNKQMREITQLRQDEHLLPNIETQHPEVCVLWATKTYGLIPVDPSRGILYFEPGEPDTVEFWKEGRKATRAEIVAAVARATVNNKLDPNDRDVAWRVAHLMRFAPPEEQAA